MSQSLKPNPWQTFNNSTLLRLLLLFACAWALVLLIGYFYNVIAIFTTAAIVAALGGFLSIGGEKVSEPEASMLKKLEQTLTFKV
ncbi:hypothetical protein [Fischerella sp.]|jgi:hypothetical protein|uniref:hypothetical protein n=1 Tax=Fischerella sp. TaxID=1191 RepID=UPI0025C03683|nr:hypothetical protein [Fischerella sp.]